MTSALQPNSYQKYDSITEALFATIHSDTDFEVEDRAQLLGLFTEWYSVLTADYSTVSTLCPLEPACALAVSTSDSLNSYHRERCTAIAEQRVFFTTSSGYIGTGPPCMQAGDEVSLLSGVYVPIILREEGPHYQVVGASYVHGLMLGEAWPRDEEELRDLTLI
jgi:hypothetical protein